MACVGVTLIGWLVVAAPLTERTPTELLAEANARYAALDFDQVVPLAAAVLASTGATVDQRLDAYWLQGSALAVVGDPVEAERPFRFLLRGKPGFIPPPETSPKIVAVFRKVQVEEAAIVDQMRALERKRLVETIALDVPALDDLVGGSPLVFDVSVRDPRGAVQGVFVRHRRAGEKSWSSLALVRGADGHWSGTLPGAMTASDDGFALEHFVTTEDAEGRILVAAGDADAPRIARVAPGRESDAAPLWTSPWFWGAIGAAGVAVAGASTAAGFLWWRAATELPPTDLGEVRVP